VGLGLARSERLPAVWTEVASDELLGESLLRMHIIINGGQRHQAVGGFCIDISTLQGTAVCGGFKYALFLRQKWRR
jgi:hypothetical protein